MKAFKQRVDHRRYNGASLVGLQGTVIKSHGGTDATGFQHAIAVAINEVDGKNRYLASKLRLACIA